jgi:hypothetical protein
LERLDGRTKGVVRRFRVQWRVDKRQSWLDLEGGERTG